MMMRPVSTTSMAGQLYKMQSLMNHTATLRNYAANSRIYNINVKNTYGEGHQALALSAYNTEQGYYGCQFTGFQGMSPPLPSMSSS